MSMDDQKWVKIRDYPKTKEASWSWDVRDATVNGRHPVAEEMRNALEDLDQYR